MKLGDLIYTELYEEVNAPKNGKGILFVDIDDTLLKPQNIFIYRKLPTDKEEVKLTPSEYAKEKVTPETKKYYDYREFRNLENVKKSIVTGLPIIPNLRMMDAHIRKGWKIGVITARGMEDVVYEALKVFLKYRDERKNLQDIGNKLVRELVYAINDANRITRLKGKTDFEKKAEIIRQYALQGYQIKFLDDDEKNVEAIKKLAKAANLNVIAVKAAKHDNTF